MSKQKPVSEVRIGHIKAAIWKNETESGTFFNVTLSRLYKDGDSWKSSDSFGRDDLLLAAKVLSAAHSRIYELQAE
jgi:hypothetical protein